jgi:pimeloyl-ACP methyl ester carboxylesterase
MIEIETHTIDVPGATLTYDIRGNFDSVTPERPALLLIGSPMDASGFGTLASYFTDRPVVTYDPRGVARSKRTDGRVVTSPDEHADDLSRLIDALGVGKVDVLASSGGAVNALALVAQHPEKVRTLVAHEPPIAQVLPDRDEVLAVNHDIHETYQRSGLGPAMAKFIAFVNFAGPLPSDYLEQPAPDPAAFGLPTEDDGSRDDQLLGQNLPTCVPYEHDLEALASSPTRIVLAAGKESMEGMAGRAAAALAGFLGTNLAIFPSNHGGFLGGEFGMYGDPPGFAAALRDTLGG